MARSEARLLNEIWKDDDFLTLPVGPQRAYMFLLSQDDLAHDGVIALRLKRWAGKAAGLTPGDFERDLEALEAARFLVIDWDTEEVLIRSLIRRDKVYRQPNVMRAAIDHVPLIESPAIVRALTTEVARIRAESTDLTTAQNATLTDMEKVLAGRVTPKPPTSPVRPTGNPTAKGSGKGSDNPSEKATAKGPRGTGSVTEVSTDFPDSPLIPPPADEASPPSRALALVEDPGPEPRTTQELVAWWVDGCDKRPDRSTIGQISKHIKALLEQDFEPVHIRRGIAELMAKELHPSQLPNLVSHAANRGAPIRAAPGKPTRTDATFAANQQVAQRFRAIEGRGS